ncbi:helix-turn-helix transcriptional regulator [Sphingomonas canadensis]|uniref:Helix-turn-helix transcriptional regulator n=1 Tax=Sphingomonas canadensis TaxID=1219257 RepID=A0ABW3H3B5_9SPHN|nr:helix-turn-helix transcriptional regulator [Sphingomonas canadensis]MCW3835665.1 helix-turn-helix transcriptional regulator [Sphingomonas canadensis]
MAQREELTRFLKAARARIAPGEVGLPAGERRRAQGLRREEVATLSGMSVTWYTWFEQGRDVQLSAAMLERLTGALKLNPQEREYLFALAQHRPPPLATTPDDVVHPAIQRMMDSLTIPAQVLTEDWTIIGWNRIVTHLFRDYSQLPPSDRNLFKILMLEPRYRSQQYGYEEMARKLTARLKWDYSRTTRLEVFDALIAEMLEVSETFRQFWNESEIVAHFEGMHTLEVAGVGSITMQHTSYVIEEAPGQRMMIFAPVDELSASRLRSVVEAMPAA